jgi:hypothetical protein
MTPHLFQQFQPRCHSAVTLDQRYEQVERGEASFSALAP